MSRDVQIQLPVEVEKDRMSSGEKQIFVMSLYWALMQQSKNALPFIIDTPFARIDTEHRHNIDMQRHITDDEFFPTLIKAHLDRGMVMLDQEQRYAGDFLTHLAELDKAL